MNQHAADKIIRARTSLLLNHFFWGRLALYLKMVEKPEIPTLAVDGKHVFYNPDFILELSDELVRSAVVHEIGHCMYEHISRRQGRDPVTWNEAGDYVINQMIIDAGMRIGPNWLHDDAFKGMYSEEVYDIIKKQKEQNGGKLPGSGKALCDVMDGPEDATPAEKSAQELEWKVAVVQTAMEAARQGNLPACMERLVNDLTENKVPWRTVLQRFATTIRRDDYTWARPNRRYVAAGAYLPALHNEGMGPMAVVIDTSGSITQGVLDAFGAEIKAIIHAVRPEKLYVIYCDAEVNHVDEFGPDDHVEFNMHGGGGTAFKPAFDHIEKLGIRPECLVYLTDLYGDHNFAAPEYPTLWCCTTNQVASFGETVHLDI